MDQNTTNRNEWLARPPSIGHLGRRGYRPRARPVAWAYATAAANGAKRSPADDLLPLVALLEPAQQLRLAKLALRAAALEGTDHAARYLATPPSDEELGSDDDGISWDAEGREGVGEKG